jgi:hypothetical protein
MVARLQPAQATERVSLIGLPTPVREWETRVGCVNPVLLQLRPDHYRRAPAGPHGKGSWTTLEDTN